MLSIGAEDQRVYIGFAAIRDEEASPPLLLLSEVKGQGSAGEERQVAGAHDEAGVKIQVV